MESVNDLIKSLISARVLRFCMEVKLTVRLSLRGIFLQPYAILAGGLFHACHNLGCQVICKKWTYVSRIVEETQRYFRGALEWHYKTAIDS